MRLGSIEDANPLWKANKRKRLGHLAKKSWEEKLSIYKKHGCAVCGQKFDTYDKGHLDPTKGYTNNNIVPMCSKCNNWAHDRVKFKLYGLIARPHCLLLSQFVNRIDYYYTKTEQVEIFTTLQKRFTV
jgi:hypothetical protein